MRPRDLRAKNLRLITGMSVAAAIAVAALAAVTSTSQAQMRGGSFSAAPRAPTVIMRTAPTAGGSSISSMKVPSISSSGMRTPSFSGSSFRAEPRFQRFNNDKVVVTDDGKGKGTDKGRGKGKGKGTDVANVDPT